MNIRNNIAVIAGLAIAFVACAQVAHADDNGSLDDSTLAVVLGPTGYPTPSDGFLNAVDQIYLDPQGFDGSTLALTTPETGDFGPSVAQGESDFVSSVEYDWDHGEFTADDPLTVFGYSQSTVVESLAEQQLADHGIPSDAIHFIMVGDTASAMGGFLNTWGETPFGEDVLNALDWGNLIGATTPDNLYPTTVYTLNGDGWPNWDNGANILGMIEQHYEYLGLTPAELSDVTSNVQQGMTDYINIADPANQLQAILDTLTAVSS